MPDWTDAKLRALVRDQVQESLTLDYKQADALVNTERNKNELAKDVSAFANSAGGTIIYGMIEEGHLPKALDNGFDPAVVTREWIEQVLRSRVQPTLPDITITSVPLSGVAQGRVAYVIVVAQGMTAHQAPDRKYYKRLNFASEPMLDYEIRDVMHRGERPLVQPDFAFLRGHIEPHLHTYSLAVALRNLGTLIVRHIQLRFTFPIALTDPPYKGYRINSRDDVGNGGVVIPVREFSFTSTDRPLFPDERVSLVEWDVAHIGYRIDHRSAEWIAQTGCRLRWRLYADSMRRREGSIPVSALHEF